MEQTTLSDNAVYFEFYQGQEVKGKYLGTFLRDARNVQLNCVYWENEQGKICVNAGADLVKKFDGIKVGSKVEIRWAGKIVTKVYDVSVLD